MSAPSIVGLNETIVLILVPMWLTVYLSATMSFSHVEIFAHVDRIAREAVRDVFLHSVSVEVLRQVPSTMSARKSSFSLNFFSFVFANQDLKMNTLRTTTVM